MKVRLQKKGPQKTVRVLKIKKGVRTKGQWGF